MTLHAGLANPTCFMVWYGSVCELRESNSKKKKKKKKKKEKKMGPIGE